MPGHTTHPTDTNLHEDAKEKHIATLKAVLADRERECRQLRQELDTLASTDDSDFRSMAETAPHFLWTCTPDGRCNYLSPQWHAYTGTTPEEIRNYGWLRSVHPEDRDSVIALWNTVTATGEKFDCEFRIRQKDGEYRWFKTRATPLRDASGAIIKWIGSNTNIQEQRDIQAQLVALNEDLEARVEQRTREVSEVNRRLSRNVQVLSDAQQIAQLGSWEYTPSTGEVTWSTELYRIFGLDPSKPPPCESERAALFTPASWELLKSKRLHCLQTGEGYEVEVDMIHHNGSQRTAIARAEVVRDEHDQIRGLVGTLQDVTARRQAEQALERAYERIRLATQAARLGIWDWDAVSNTLIWDETMYTLYGVDPANFSGAHDAWQSCLLPEDQVTAQAAVIDALEGRTPFNTEFSIKKPDGSIRHLRATAITHLDADGMPLRMVGVNWDVTEQRQAERALRDSEARLQEFVANAPVAIAMLDKDRRYVLTSNRWRKEFGLENAAIVGLQHEAVFPYVFKSWPAVHARVLAGSLEQCEEEAFKNPDGTLTWLRWEARPWCGKTDEITGILLVCQIITARKQLQDQMLQQKEELERSNDELEQFAYVASHDLQEPLRAVTGCGQILERRYRDELDEQGQQLIRHIVDGASRMQLLIRDLLSFSRVGTRGQAFTPVSLQSVIELAKRNLDQAIRESGAVIHVESLPTVSGDSSQLVQLMQNLLSNAIKYRGIEPPDIRISAETDGHTWTIRVRDNGIGIDPKYFERIFIIFQRLHTRTEYPGTGIGLAICKKIVDRHGGQLWLESEPGQGTEFFVSLPTIYRAT